MIDSLMFIGILFGWKFAVDNVITNANIPNFIVVVVYFNILFKFVNLYFSSELV